MKVFFKVLLVVISLLIIGLLVFAVINLKSVLLAFGVGRLDVKDYDSVVSTLEESDLYTDIIVLDESDDGTTVIKCSTDDGVADLVIRGIPGEKVTKIEAEIHGEKLQDIDPTDINALTEKAKAYLSPILPDDQVLGFTGFIAKEALSQYNRGKTHISIEKEFGDVLVSIDGDIDTQQFTIEVITGQ
jgi:hypothetical protein